MSLPFSNVAGLRSRPVDVSRFADPVLRAALDGLVSTLLGHPMPMVVGVPAFARWENQSCVMNWIQNAARTLNELAFS